jgi:hypothetical protein
MKGKDQEQTKAGRETGQPRDNQDPKRRSKQASKQASRVSEPAVFIVDD